MARACIKSRVSDSIPIPSITIENTSDQLEDDDEVFLDDKSNISSGLSPFRRSLFPSLTTASSPSLREVCANSPGRSVLHRQSIDSFFDAKVLGKGSFGSVVLGTWKGRRVAVKVITKEPTNPGHHRHDSVESELNAVDLEHESIVRIFGVYPGEGSNAIVIMEYVGKANLQTLMDTHPEKIDSRFVQNCFVSISSALAFLHSMQILHLDVKPGNVLVTSDGLCKLGDFGCSRKIGCRKNTQKGVLVGTSGYQAPELLRNEIPSPKCDVYSFGVFMWHVLHKHQPFKGLHPHVVMFQVVTQSLRPQTDETVTFPANYREIYSSCWQQEPSDRPQMTKVNSLLQKKKMRLSPRSRSRSRSSRRPSSIRL